MSLNRRYRPSFHHSGPSAGPSGPPNPSARCRIGCEASSIFSSSGASASICVPISVGRGGRRLGEDLTDRVADLVDLPEGGQEVHGPRLLAVVELLAVHVHLEPALLGRGQRDRGLTIVHGAQLGRHTDGYGEVPSVDAVDDLDVDSCVGHVLYPPRCRPQCASGSGRSWKCTAIGFLPLPPSISHGARSPLAVQSPRPFQPAFGSSIRPSKPLA